ncbi:MAG: histidine--tRNA ligase [Cyanobacteriota bacterium]|nr:histidine--tRNA ligase [Cyanobacteriota bacterium]
MEIIQATRGTRDILPAEVAIWQHVEAVARRILACAGYQEIRTPIFEVSELFVRGIGTATDVVGKEMYSFTTRGEKEVTLRPENTAGVVRAYIQHSLYASGDTQRLWYGGPMFRYERPQAGRQRQFHQLGIEVLGSADARADAEVIAIAFDILQALNVKSLHLLINSVGDPQDRLAYRQALIDYLTPHQADLDADSQQRLTRNPLRILDSKDARTREIVAGAPRLLDYLGDPAQQHFAQVQAQLTALGIPYQVDPLLVRGLDYYTHTAFEIQSQDLGAQSTVCGGGRYDGLVEELAGPPTPAVGWAMGLERLILLLQSREAEFQPGVDLYIISRGSAAEAQALPLAQQLRQAGFVTELDLSGSGFAKQMKRANRRQARWAVILGDAEAANQTLQLKNLLTAEQVTLPYAHLRDYLKEHQLAHPMLSQGRQS